MDALDRLVAQLQLRDDTMYIWFEQSLKKGVKPDEYHFYHLPLAPISEYHHWTEDHFREELAKLADRERGE